MELSPLLQHFVQTGFDIAESQLKEGKDFISQITLLAEGKDGLAFAPIIGLADVKSLARTAIKYAWDKMLSDQPQLKLLAITFMSDVFLESIDSLSQLRQKKFIPPSQKPGSREAIILQLTLADTDFTYMWEYVRSDTGVVFDVDPKKSLKQIAVLPGL